MFKRLVRIGNSRGLVIDKPMMELLSLSPSERVRIRTDGRRLVIEAASDTDEEPWAAMREPNETALLLDARRVIDTLMNQRCMPNDVFRQLQPSYERYIAYRAALLLARPDNEEIVSIARTMHHALRMRVRGVEWEHIVELLAPKRAGAVVTPGPGAVATPGPGAAVTPGPAAVVTPGPGAVVTPGPGAAVTPGPQAADAA